MLTTIEAEIDANGKVTFLEPLKINKKSRAIITLLNDEDAPKKEANRKPKATESDEKNLQLEWLKANRNQYAGKYVALDGDNLLASAETMKEIREKIKDFAQPNIFITKVFAEETILSAGL